MKRTKKVVHVLDADDIILACGEYAKEQEPGYEIGEVKIRWNQKNVEVTLVQGDEA